MTRTKTSDLPELLEWERARYDFFIAESKNRRPQEIIAMLDKLLPPPAVWYDQRPQLGAREEQGDGIGVATPPANPES